MSETVAPAAPAAAPSGVVASAASALAAAWSFLTQKMFICRPDLQGLLRRSGAGGSWDGNPWPQSRPVCYRRSGEHDVTQVTRRALCSPMRNSGAGRQRCGLDYFEDAAGVG
jgi:hypothetical protein